MHLTPEDACAYAKGAASLLITHVGPTLTAQAATDRAAAVFGGPTDTAYEGTTKII